jgi:hypothetical protein
MTVRLPRWLRRLLVWGVIPLVCLAVLAAAVLWYLSSWRVAVIPVSSPEGQALLARAASEDYEPIRQHWVLQEQMLCCAASAVIVMNALQPGAGYTQDGIFTPATAPIITKDEFTRGLCTVEKLAVLVPAVSGLKAAYLHAGPGQSEHDIETFRAHLASGARRSDDHIILNYSVAFFAGLGEGGGHCSPVAAYDPQSDLVLVLDVAGKHRWHWMRTADLYGAMNTTDRVSHVHRGWVVVSK